MDYIFHEKQEGSLCAQHCLNALLQEHYYTAVDLADIGQHLDESERIQMAEAGTDSKEYKQFIKKPSDNYDDSGYFSIQVLQKAVHVWGLELIPFNSSHEHAVSARKDAVNQSAYICNFKDHWFSIRKIGLQWFNLNSLLSGPELISNTYLMLFLSQLQKEGYSIFVVTGELQPCYADQILQISPAVQSIKPSLISDSSDKSNEHMDDSLKEALSASESHSNEELEYALRISLLDDATKEEEMLQAAINLSLQVPE